MKSKIKEFLISKWKSFATNDWNNTLHINGVLKFFNKEVCIICGKIEPLGLDNNVCNSCWDEHYARIGQAHLDMKDEWENECIATPCGCTIFNDCSTCGNYTICDSLREV